MGHLHCEYFLCLWLGNRCVPELLRVLRSFEGDPVRSTILPDHWGRVLSNLTFWLENARAPLNSFDFGPRLDDGKEFYCILFRADFHVAQAIDEPLDEAPLPDSTLLHAREVG